MICSVYIFTQLYSTFMLNRFQNFNKGIFCLHFSLLVISQFNDRPVGRGDSGSSEESPSWKKTPQF